MPVPDCFLQSIVLLSELELAVLVFLLMEIFAEIIGPSIIELLGSLEISSFVKQSSLVGYSLMHYTQIRFFRHFGLGFCGLAHAGNYS